MTDATLIIPVYCRTAESVEWLDECVGSAIRQNCDVIAWDDASPQEVASVFQKYNISYGRFEQNRGVSAARNAAVEQCRTTLIFPLDCDDILKDDAIKTLLEQWHGVPVYPDLELFGARNVAHYDLKDFSCERLASTISIASVNVLHAVEQWYEIGGWRSDIKLYEDGEYNGRLMAEYGGLRVPLPLVRYRQHKEQRSRAKNAAEYGRDVTRIIGGYVMAGKCCGRGRSSGSNNGGAKQMTAAQNNGPKFYSRASLDQGTKLPGSTEERVLARYIGGRGRTAHYYRGPVTKFPYKVVHGAIIPVDARDTVASEADVARSLLVAIEQPKKKKEVVAPAPSFFRPKEEPTPEPVAVEETVDFQSVDTDNDLETELRKVVGEIEQAQDEEFIPIEDPDTKEVYDIPNIRGMNYRQLVNSDITPWEAERMLELETAGKKRTKHVAYLQRVIRNG